MRSGSSLRARLLASALSVGVLSAAFGAQAADQEFNIAPQSLDTALADFSRQSMIPVLATPSVTGSKRTSGVSGAVDAPTALAMLLQGTGLTYRQEGATFLIVKADTGPQSGSAAGDGAEVEALIVTAQKREEDIQDVPIAISAFTQEQLDRSQVAGGPDLMTQVPNMTFTKTNFTGYSIQLRGIGTQAISATTDAAVAVAFNNTPFIRNRFFEQEFYDLQRIEVLRGPQGTLYGRNATAGVVNLISQKPKFAYQARLSGDLANYNSSRIEGMMNIPLAEDTVALRLAGAWTRREGYSTNQITGNPIDGRDLWSTRVSLRVAPTERLDVNLIWEHFEENDDRLRSGKQLCKTDNVTEVNAELPDGTVINFPVAANTGLPGETVSQLWSGVQGTFSQGCRPSSLYSQDSFGTPNGISLPYVHALGSIGVPLRSFNDDGTIFDPYASRTQSTDLRVIESTVDPHYQAKTDVVELQFSYDITDTLTLNWETGYGTDTIFSTQDYNRFNTSSGVFNQVIDQPGGGYNRENLVTEGPNGGVFCDPQIGCADRLVAVDLSTAKSKQFSQELRVSSNYDGPFNFSLGGNFLLYDTEDKYYVFINTLSLFAALSPFTAPFNNSTGGGRGELPPYIPNVSENIECLRYGFRAPEVGQVQTVNGCIYVDPNRIGNLNDRGHNYFLSKNPYKLISYAVFGEAYYNITDALKLTAGFRWTVDRKEAPRHPSWVIAADSVGHPSVELVESEWRVPTGRLTIDWKPKLSFTDETLLYASYGHGYKAGGMNPPVSGVVCYFCNAGSSELAEGLLAAVHPKKFDAEYIDAFELGAKNTLLDGTVTVNLAAFYYDYRGYQISQIVNRAAVNQNFDATVWGLEIEADWRALENLRLGFKGGYENTRVADGMSAVDVMDRTGGDPYWILVRPFPTFPSNCILPAHLFVGDTSQTPGTQNLVNVGNRGTGGYGPCELAYVLGRDPITGLPYVPDPTAQDVNFGSTLSLHPGYAGWDPATAPNKGAGVSKDLSGNELPNAPHFTATVTADYTLPLPNDWLATLHTDLYYQAEAWTRIFNTEGYDKLKAYTNVNVAAIFTNEEAGWKVMAYVKNVFDRDSITGAFLNSDDTGLTTNIFLTEPRLYGLRVTKEWNGGPWWTGANPEHTGPYPFTVELSGMAQRQDARYEPIAPTAFADLPANLNPSDELQNRDLDWGDGRSLRLIWRPAASPWSISATGRYGRTNTDTARKQDDVNVTLDRCAYRTTQFFYTLVCIPGSPFYDSMPLLRTWETTDWTDVAVYSREEHNIADLEVGYDWSAGWLSRSTVHAGVRHAEFESTTDYDARALGNWVVPNGWLFLPGSYDITTVNTDAVREFSGAGPILAWDAASTLWSGDRAGRLDVDWTVSAGALFGEQETAFKGEERTTTYSGPLTVFPNPAAGTPLVTAAPGQRSQSATVPFVDISLGLSYEVGRFKAGAGYRWERYSDVLDVGYDEEQSEDRTIDGPYFKIAVSFGG